jgi:Ca-activated chloride channel homolog
MIGFAEPIYLLFVPLAVAAAWQWQRRRKPALRYSDLSLFEGLPQGRGTILKHGPMVLRMLVLVLLVLAAANPRRPDRTTRLPADGIAIVLALDVSNSMATPDFGTPGSVPISRLDAAKSTFTVFVKGGDEFPGRATDSLGLVAFAAVPRTPCPITLNHSVLLAVLNEQQPRSGVDSGTNIGDAIAEGLHRLEAAGAKRKVLVLLSDGEHNVVKDGADAPLTPLAAAELARALGVPVYPIDCGGDPTGDDEQQQQRRDGRDVLRQVAERTGGQSFAANDSAGLRAAYAAIDALERTPVESYRYRRYVEAGPWLGLTALGLFVLLLSLEQTRWRGLP